MIVTDPAQPHCHSCGRDDCPASGKPYVDDCPLWQEAEERANRGEYLPTFPLATRRAAPTAPPKPSPPGD
jgi:hypothetical protein